MTGLLRAGPLRLTGVLLSAFLGALLSGARAESGGASDSAQSYRLTTETTMPHLEENLRYAITHETRCLTRTELLTAFPVLNHPSMRGCTLGAPRESDEGRDTSRRRESGEGGETGGPPERRESSRLRETRETLVSELACHPDHGTKGEARWETRATKLRGTLRVRLGGKNMTFSQYITAVPLGACTR